MKSCSVWDLGNMSWLWTGSRVLSFRLFCLSLFLFFIVCLSGLFCFRVSFCCCCLDLCLSYFGFVSICLFSLLSPYLCLSFVFLFDSLLVYLPSWTSCFVTLGLGFPWSPTFTLWCFPYSYNPFSHHHHHQYHFYNDFDDNETDNDKYYITNPL